MAHQESADDVYQLTIAGNGISIERSIDGKTLGAVIALVMGGDIPVTGSPVAEVFVLLSMNLLICKYR